MFLPLHDNTPLRMIRFQFVTGILILLNFLAFTLTYLLVPEKIGISLATGLGAVPALYTGVAVLDPSLYVVPEPFTLITYMFLHAGWLHLIANMAFLWVLADNIEDAFGHIGFLIFYLICGVVAALTHTLFNWESQAPLIGASGAVSGVIASYLVLFPRARVWVLLFLKIPLPIPAVFALVGWFGIQVASLFIEQEGEVIVAWWAHIGGFLTGFLITLLFRSKLRQRLSIMG